MKVVIKLRKPDSLWDKYIGRIQKVAETAVMYDNDSPSDEEAEVLITTNLKKEVLLKFPNLRQILLFKTGMDNLPLEEIKKRGIAVRASHANADVIAEHGLALSLALLHRTVEFHNDLSIGNWCADGQNIKWKSISELRLGILGYGAIGKCLHRKLETFCDDIIVLNRSEIYPNNVNKADSFEDLVQKCDMIYICLPKTDETEGMFDEEVLQKMHGKYIVNVGRAEICCEKALYEALESGQLAGFASDVWFREPDKTDKMRPVMPSLYPFWNLKNVVMSPHCATHETNAHERYIKDAAEACIRYIAEKEKS